MHGDSTRPVTVSSNRLIAWVFLIAGVGALGYCANFYIHAAYAQSEGRRMLAKLPDEPITPVHAPYHPKKRNHHEGDLVGQIDIPRVGVSAIIFEGTDDPTLASGVGHLVSSPLP